jgi:P4 family phage/plasmid primase-like protien
MEPNASNRKVVALYTMKSTDFSGRSEINAAREADLPNQYADAGIKPLRLHPETKRPVVKEWQRRSELLTDIAEWARQGKPIGWQVGQVSRWICVVDCDWPETIRLAPRFLPETLTIHKGHEKPSLWVYRSEGLGFARFSAPDASEVLCTKASNNGAGHQVVVPPSVHPEKGPYDFTRGWNPAAIAEILPDDLQRRCRMLATSALISRRLPEKGRHVLSLAYAGFMIRNGASPEDVTRVLVAAWEDHNAPPGAIESLRRNVTDTDHKIAEGEPVTGGDRLGELIPGMPRRIARFLGWKDTSYNDGCRLAGEGEVGDADHHDLRSALLKGPVGMLCTDTANAERFARRFKGEVIYVPRFGWLAWDGRRYRMDHAGFTLELGKKVPEIITEEAKLALSEGRVKDGKALFSWAVQSLSRGKIDSLLALARSIPGIVVEHDKLDRDGLLFNCLSGTVDLRTGNLKPHDKADLITKLAPVEYDPNMATPVFDGFLEQVLPSEALRRFVQRLFGLYLSSSVAEQILVVFYGAGANGKSTLINLMMEVLGIGEDGYGYPAPHDFLMLKSGDSHPTEKAALFGKRLVAAIETERGMRLAESFVKQLTGSDPVTARFMRQDFFTFMPTHKVLLAANHKPVINGTDHAIWRRIKLVPFEVVIPNKAQDKQLPEKLKEELPGILAWAVRGGLAWQKEGLGEPDAVTSATQEYRDDQDHLGDFIAEECYVDHNVSVLATPLFKAYEHWCFRNGEPSESQTMFGQRLIERGFRRERASSGRDKGKKRYIGISLLHKNGDDPSLDIGGSEHPSTGESPAKKGENGEAVNTVNGSEPKSRLNASTDSSRKALYRGKGSLPFTTSTAPHETPVNGDNSGDHQPITNRSPGERLHGTDKTSQSVVEVAAEDVWEGEY